MRSNVENRRQPFANELVELLFVRWAFVSPCGQDSYAENAPLWHGWLYGGKFMQRRRSWKRGSEQSRVRGVLRPLVKLKSSGW